MKIITEFENLKYQVDLGNPISIGIPLQNGDDNPNAFYAAAPRFEAYRSGGFVGSMAEGAPINYFNVSFNPHGNGTHTECKGHIHGEHQSLDDELKHFHFVGRLISIPLSDKENGDKVVTDTSCLDELKNVEALAIRTLPNDRQKLDASYSGKNPAYITPDFMQVIAKSGVRHLMVDLPSVDREEDEGALTAHKLFWDEGKGVSITEMIFVPDEIQDGLYLFNIMVPRVKLDAFASNIVLYKMEVPDA